MPNERMFHAPNADLQALAEDLAQWLQAREFQTQILPVEGEGTLVQARQEGGWKSALGMGLATNVVIRQMGESIKVEAGQGKWIDKAVVGAVGLLLLWPALIPAAIGTWQQSKLPEQIFAHVASYLAAHPAGDKAPGAVAKAAAQPTFRTCPECSTNVPATAKFCPECGHAFAQDEEVAEKALACRNCGAELAPNAKFCAECGTPVTAS